MYVELYALMINAYELLEGKVHVGMSSGTERLKLRMSSADSEFQNRSEQRHVLSPRLTGQGEQKIP